MSKAHEIVRTGMRLAEFLSLRENVGSGVVEGP